MRLVSTVIGLAGVKEDVLITVSVPREWVDDEGIRLGTLLRVENLRVEKLLPETRKRKTRKRK